MENIVIEGITYACSVLDKKTAAEGAWILDPEHVPFLIVQVMNDQLDPYMMIRALDGTKIRLVNSEEYSRYFLLSRQSD